MSRHALLNLALALALVGLAGLHLALAPRPTQRNLELLPEMVDSVPYDAYAPSPVFADGKTLQAPPAGTIPRGLLPLHYAPGPQEAARAGRELANPRALPAVYAEGAELPPTLAAARAGQQAAFDRDLARGEAVYAVYCALCHGATGAGDGTVAKRGFPAPPSLLAENARKMADGRMFHLITYGGENMPPYAVQVSREERWQAILHVRELQRKGPAVVEEPAPPAAQPTTPTRPVASPEEPS